MLTESDNANVGNLTPTSANNHNINETPNRVPHFARKSETLKPEGQEKFKQLLNKSLFRMSSTSASKRNDPLKSGRQSPLSDRNNGSDILGRS